MIELYSAQFFKIAIIHFAAAISPGADMGIVLRESIRLGRRAGIYTAIGTGIGAAVHISYTLLGAAALLKARPWIMTVIECVGGAYLLYLGILFIKNASNFSIDLNNNTEQAVQALHTRKSFLRGFFTNLSNPKAPLFFLTVFTTLVDPVTPFRIQVLYGIWICISTVFYFSMMGVLLTRPKIREKFLRCGPWIDRVAGGVFILLALGLLIEAAYQFL